MAAEPMQYPMDPPGDPNAPTFLVLYCAACARQVLSACELDEDSQLVDICLHCEAPLDRDDGSARWLDAAALDAHGYFVEGSEKRDTRHAGGGCRGKSCGIKQPE